MFGIWYGRLRREERGFTLPELMATIVILGILTVIAVLIFLALLERWRVNTAANQLASDLRLAHTSATNQLTDWRVVLVPEQEDSEHPDYYLIKLKAPDTPSSSPTVDKCTARVLPANVYIRDHDGALNDSLPASPGCSPTPLHPLTTTRSLEFNSDGTMAFRKGPSGSICVTIDTNPQVRIVGLSSTSRVKIEDQVCTAGDEADTE